MDCRTDDVQLMAGNVQFEAFSSAYTNGCSVTAPMVAVATDKSLEKADLAHRIVLLYGEIAAHQLMPKNFPLYNPDEHRQITETT